MTKHEELKTNSIEVDCKLNGKRRRTDPDTVDCDARSSQNGDTEPLKLSPLLNSAAQHRRRNSKGKAIGNGLTLSNGANLNGGDVMKELSLDDAASAHSKHSDIDQMIAEDINKTFNETASIISDLQSHKELYSHQTAQALLEAESQMMSHPLPPPPQPAAPPKVAASGGVSFGTMFTAAPGSIFGNAPAQPADPSKSALPPLHQNAASDPVKRTAADSWKGGEWVTPENLKETPTKRKKGSKAIELPESTNTTSKVAAITVDIAMQRAMVDMGLRVLTTKADRRFGQNGRDEPVQMMFRCYGCYTNEHDTTRTHCRQCGGMTFQRVFIFLDENGKAHHRYSARDRWGGRYLEKYNLVPKGSQLVKYEGTGRNNPNWAGQARHNKRGRGGRRNNRRMRQHQNGNGYRGGGQRW